MIEGKAALDDQQWFLNINGTELPYCGMDKSKSPHEPDKVFEVDLLSRIFYPLIQSTRNITTGIAGGMAFYWLQAEQGVWEVPISLLSILIVVWVVEIFLMPMAENYRP